jgi:aminopeptidase YwaD
MLNTLLLAFALAPASTGISVDEITSHVRTLASAEMEGRLTLSAGEARAAEYIAKEFASYGLEEGPHKGYLHLFQAQVNQRPTENNSLTVLLAGGRAESPKVGADYMPLVGSAPNKLIAGEVVFVGYGFDATDWNDYAGVDVENKVVMAFRGAPQGRQPMSNGAKARIAATKGAVGIIFVGPSAEGRSEIPRTTRGQGIPADLGLVALGVHSRFFNEWTGLSYSELARMSAPSSRSLPITVRMRTELEPNRGIARNVIGYLPGNDPALKDEFVIVGAHYDHLGYGETGSRTGVESIHWGADDNASGTAAVLALAKHFAQTRTNRRTMIFQLYSGEEIGLVGSGAWARENPEILKRTTLMINLDMVGRLRGGQLYVFGTSTAEPLDGLLKEVSVPGLKILAAPHTRGDSDQASFARRNVPVLFLHTGLHDEYHTERDHVDTINMAGIKTVVDGTAQILDLVDRRPRLEFSEGAVLGNMPTDRRVPPPVAEEEEAPRRIFVGFVPDMGASGPGVLISGTSPNSPAQKAGFQAGDRIIEFGGRKVDDLEGLQAAMVATKPGQKVKIVFVRDGKQGEVELVVEAREQALAA